MDPSRRDPEVESRRQSEQTGHLMMDGSRVRQFLPATILAASAAFGQEPTAVDPLVADAAQRLAAIGYDVPEQVRSLARDSKQVIADLDAQQELFLPADAFVIQHALFDRFGLPAGRDAAALRQQAIAGMARGLSAYYDPIGKVFVLLPSATREVSEALAGGLLPLFTHELVHAHQDARPGGLRGYFGGDGRTLDTGMAHRCAAEGEAEIAALVALRGDDAVAQIEGPSSAGVLDRLFGGELTGLIYESGRRLAAALHGDGGLEAVRGLWRRAPLSTEQILHVGKYGTDAPTAVVVPDVPGLTRAHATTIGELLIFNLLRQQKLGRLDASLAAAGWDGDQFVVFDRGDEVAVAVAWRSVWDRDEDAADFAGRLQAMGRGVVEHSGRVVDWSEADSAEVHGAIGEALAADRVQPAANAADAASTAAAEAELRAELDQARVDGAWWNHDALGVAVPLLEGWQVREVNGVEMLLHEATAKAGFAINVNVMAQPRGGLADLAEMIEQNRAQLDQMKLEVVAMATTLRGDVEVVECEYAGRIGRMPPMRFLALAWLRGEQQVWVTATSTEKLWPEHADALRELMAAVRVTAP